MNIKTAESVCSPQAALGRFLDYLFYAAFYAAASFCFLALMNALTPETIGQAIRMIIMTGSFILVRIDTLSIRLSIKIIPKAPAKTPSALITAIRNGFDFIVFIFILLIHKNVLCLCFCVFVYLKRV